MSGIGELTKNKPMLYDGAKGALLQEMAPESADCVEHLNVTQPEVVKKIHEEYIRAGADIIQTNTFCANGVLLEKQGLEKELYEINFNGAKIALECAEGKALVAASIGPTGRMLEPAGDASFEDVVGIYKQQLEPLVDAGIKTINFETFMDLAEMRAAIVAAREMGIYDIIASMTFEGERTISGNTPESCAISCSAAGAQVVGANCSGGPESLLGPVGKMNDVGAFPLGVKPNAGLPEIIDGKAVYSLSPEDFARSVPDFLQCGARLIGGCCGSTPAHIEAMRRAIDGMEATACDHTERVYLSSGYEYAEYGLGFRDAKMLITPDILNAIKDGDYYCILDSLPEDLDEAGGVLVDFADATLCFDMWGFVSTASTLIKKPVILKTDDTELAEAFLRYYCGRAGLITQREVYDAYGAMIII